MSLQLRQQAEKVLERHKLNNYHVRIDDALYMNIVGECGQPLVTIYGIKFTKKTPTKSEIEYALTLLDSFLIKHSKDIKHYVAKYIEFKKLPEVMHEKGKYTISKSWRFPAEKLEDCSVQFLPFEDIKDISVRVYHNKNVTVEINQISLEIYNKRIPPKMLKEAQEYLESFVKYQTEKFKLDDLKAKLNKCDI